MSAFDIKNNRVWRFMTNVLASLGFVISKALTCHQAVGSRAQVAPKKYKSGIIFANCFCDFSDMF